MFAAWFKNTFYKTAFLRDQQKTNKQVSRVKSKSRFIITFMNSLM